MGVPRNIFLFWEQGVDSAPSLVRLCIASWRQKNPTWRLVVLSNQNLSQWVSREELLPQTAMTTQKRSNLLRLALLLRHGGVWADATLFCLKPLDSWLPTQIAGGFLCPRKANPDRLIGTYFIAAHPNSEFLRKWRKLYLSYLASGARPLDGQQRSTLWIQFCLWVLRSNNWFKLMFTWHWVGRTIGYPYFIFNYFARRTMLGSLRFRKFLKSMPDVPAADSLGRAYQRGYSNVDKFAEALDLENKVILKLSWKQRRNLDFWDRFHVLIQGRYLANP